MKNYFLVLFALVAFTSCEEYVNSAVDSEVTYLPTINVEGERSVTLECNTTGGFDDPGATATEGGAEIPLKTTITGLYFDGSTIESPDLWNIAYSAYNVDSIPGAATRSVLWPECNGDMVNSIAGMYTAAVVRTTVSSGATNADYASETFGPYFVKDMGDDVYGISDAIGSFYQHGYGYGIDYAAFGMTVKANNIATNDFTLDGESTLPWGGDITLTKFTVDPVAKTIKFTSEWTLGYKFDVTLTQVP